MGRLWREGVNRAVDVAVLRACPEFTEVLTIKRRSGEWALPGGFLDVSEEELMGALRELYEETGLTFEWFHFKHIFTGKVADPRNEEDRWIETTLFVVRLAAEWCWELEPRAGDDATDVRWLRCVDENIRTLYADHPRLVQMALKGGDDDDSDSKATETETKGESGGLRERGPSDSADGLLSGVRALREDSSAEQIRVSEDGERGDSQPATVQTVPETVEGLDADGLLGRASFLAILKRVAEREIKRIDGELCRAYLGGSFPELSGQLYGVERMLRELRKELGA